jgi:hypothetical protein
MFMERRWWIISAVGIYTGVNGYWFLEIHLVNGEKVFDTGKDGQDGMRLYQQDCTRREQEEDVCWLIIVPRDAEIFTRCQTRVRYHTTRIEP